MWESDDDYNDDDDLNVNWDSDDDNDDVDDDDDDDDDDDLQVDWDSDDDDDDDDDLQVNWDSDDDDDDLNVNWDWNLIGWTDNEETFQKGTTLKIATGWIDNEETTSWGIDNATREAAVAKAVTILREYQSNVKNLILRADNAGQLDMLCTMALTTCTELESLEFDLEFTDATSSDSFAHTHTLGVGLLKNKNLRTLRIRCVKLTLDVAQSLKQGLSENTSLSTLDVDTCYIANEGALRVFCEGLESATSLRDVIFGRWYEQDGQVLADHKRAALVEALRNSSELESLRMIDSIRLDRGMIAVASLLDSTPLKKIDLSFQRMNENESLNIFHLTGALGRTTTLESLELRGNRLSTDHAMANLVAALAQNTSVKYLDLSWNFIRSSAMDIFVSNLPSMKHLEKLNIEHLDDKASKNLANAMKENFHLRDIRLSLWLPDYKTIIYYVDLNWAGRRFIELQDKTYSFIPSSLWPLVFSRVTSRHDKFRVLSWGERQANIIYYCLQKGSVLFPV